MNNMSNFYLFFDTWIALQPSRPIMASEVQIESSQPREGADYVTKTVCSIDNFPDANLAYCLHMTIIKHII